MAGKYASIMFDEGTISFRGQTHGCSCCSHTETVTVKRIDEHIEELEADIAAAREVKAKIEKVEVFKEGLQS